MRRFVCILGMQLVAALPPACMAQERGADSMEVRLTHELTTGRVRLPPLRFTKAGVGLEPASTAILRVVGRAMASLTGSFVIEAHVRPTADATADQAYADRRANTVRLSLIDLGVAPGRLYAVGVGRERNAPPRGTNDTGAVAGLEHIDIARLR